MSPETSVFLLWLVLVQEGAAFKSVVTFTPNYKKIFTTEFIRMTCNVESTGGEDLTYIWYKDDNQVHNGKSYRIENAGSSDSGNYRCVTSTGEISNPARLDVSETDSVILQTPLYVYEGDEMRLRCHHYPGYRGRRARFYKENNLITYGSYDEELHIGNVERATAGTYKCRKQVNTPIPYYRFEDEASVSVEELFPTPTIRVTPNPAFRNDQMTLKCETSLPPVRQNTQLQFAFYNDGRTVREFGDSDAYKFNLIQLEHSGKYSCEVQTTDGRVRKKSAEESIQIEELFPTPTIKVTPNPVFRNDQMTLKCETSLPPVRQNTQLQFAFYNDGRTVRGFGDSDAYKVNLVQLEHSGNYSCEVQTKDGKVRKKSAEEPIQIEGPTDNIGYPWQNIVRLTLSACVAIIGALFVFYHIKWMRSMEKSDRSTT